MIASPLGGLYDAAADAEHEGETGIRWRVEDTKEDYFVTPTAEFRLEDHEASPMPRLIKIERLESPARLTAHGDWFLQRKKKTGVCTYSAPFY